MNKKPNHIKRTKMIGFLVTPDLERRLRVSAAVNGTTLSTLIYNILSEVLPEAHELKEPEAQS
jgi:hypothetical protein